MQVSITEMVYDEKHNFMPNQSRTSELYCLYFMFEVCRRTVESVAGVLGIGVCKHTVDFMP